MIRPGQALFNALLELDPDFVEIIRGTAADPFYHDDRIPACLRAWRVHLIGMQRPAQSQNEEP
jgi:hypothetical protein